MQFSCSCAKTVFQIVKDNGFFIFKAWCNFGNCEIAFGEMRKARFNILPFPYFKRMGIIVSLINQGHWYKRHVQIIAQIVSWVNNSTGRNSAPTPTVGQVKRNFILYVFQASVRILLIIAIILSNYFENFINIGNKLLTNKNGCDKI